MGALGATGPGVQRRSGQKGRAGDADKGAVKAHSTASHLGGAPAEHVGCLVLALQWLGAGQVGQQEEGEREADQHRQPYKHCREPRAAGACASGSGEHRGVMMGEVGEAGSRPAKEPGGGQPEAGWPHAGCTAAPLPAMQQQSSAHLNSWEPL